jgi:predicted small metal-binding protein
MLLELIFARRDREQQWYDNRHSFTREGTTMAKVLRCRDLGMDCPKEVRAETEDELLKLAAEHAEKDHGISATMIPPSILAMVKSAIKDE